jgi:signal transduction histidine kinase/ActR/RegA family two-component response regulator
MDSHPLYNSRIIDSYLKLLRKEYPHVDENEVMAHAGIKAYEVADQGHWFTQEHVDRFYEKLTELTGNPDIARQAGRYAASPEALGTLRPYVLGLLGPGKIFSIIGKTARYFTRSSTFKSRKIASNRFEITVTPRNGINEKPYQCQNRLGILESAPLFFGAHAADVQHPECIFNGGASCRYLVSWKKSPSEQWRIVRTVAGIFLGLACLITLQFWPQATLQWIVPTAALLLMAMSLFAERRKINELRKTLAELREATSSTLEQINANYNNALLTNEIGQTISKKMDLDEILSEVVQILEKRLDYDRGMILLANPEKTKLVFHSGFGYSDEQQSMLKDTVFRLSNPDSKGIFVVSFREQKSFLINDFNKIQSDLSLHSLAIAKKLGAKSFICCPIICDGEPLGILATDNLRSKKNLVHSDMSLLMGIAPIIGISIHNAMHVAKELHMAEQMRQIQKMEAVGRLAGGIAHDFNNLLTVISGYSDLLLSRVGKDSPNRMEIEEIRKAGKRATALTSQLLAFSRKQMLLPKVIDLNNVVTETIAILRRLIGEHIELATELEKTLAPVLADPGQIEQVIMNLVVNARDAMPNGGIITIETNNVVLEELLTNDDDIVQPGQYVMLSVRDTGSGMDEETKSHIFEPFFTTKETGKGTGLGLATVYGIIRQSEGHISVDSTPGSGTLFKLFFPRAQQDIVGTQPALPAEKPLHGIETILVVEDEEVVRNLVINILRSAGYTVIEAAKPTDALKIRHDAAAPIQLLLTDVVMPVMNGREMAGRLIENHRDMRVLFMSGYSDDIIAHHGVLSPGTAFIEKPFTPESLKRKVREVLDSTTTRFPSS